MKPRRKPTITLNQPRNATEARQQVQAATQRIENLQKTINAIKQKIGKR